MSYRNLLLTLFFSVTLWLAPVDVAQAQPRANASVSDAGFHDVMPEAPDEETADPVAKVAAGLYHSALIHYDGHVYTWGDNSYGQLGLPQVDYTDEPTWLSLSSPAIDISLGAYHTLILTQDGHVYACGRNTFGQLGNQSTVDAPLPARVDGLPKIKAISAGAFHSLALDHDGNVWAWGNNTDGQVGAVESQDILDLDETVIGQRSLTPQIIVSEEAEAIAAGGSHSLYLSLDAQVFAWGDNSRGQLGNGTIQSHDIPALVAGLSDIAAISAGYQHNLALSQTNQEQQVFAWGDDSFGQTGLGQHDARSPYRAVPARIDWQSLFAGEKNLPYVDKLAAGLSHSAMTLQSEKLSRDQRLLFWGSHEYGQLGQAGSQHYHAAPQLLSDQRAGFSGTSFLSFESIALGGYHSLILSRQGLLAATGRGGQGQLGTSSIVNRDQFTAVAIPDLIRPLFLSESRVHVFWQDDTTLGLRFPKAQDNLASKVSYRVQITYANRERQVFDLGESQEFFTTAIDPDRAFEVVVAAYDEAGIDAPIENLSRLVAHHIPEGQDPEILWESLARPLTTDYDPMAFAHRFKPTLPEPVHPLQVPWDVTPLQSDYARQFPQPPNWRGFYLVAAVSALLLVGLIADRLRSLNIQASRQKDARMDD